MGKKKKTAAGENSGPSKADAIRAYWDKLGHNARPKDIVDGLKADGIIVSPAQVSTLRPGRKTKKKVGRRKGTVAAGTSGRKPGRKTSNVEVPVSALVAAKKFSEEVGSVEKAKAVLDALSAFGLK